MVKAKKIPFSESYVISKDELWRLNMVLTQIDQLSGWLAKDKRAMIILEALRQAAKGKYHKEPYQIRDDLQLIDQETLSAKSGK